MRSRLQIPSLLFGLSFVSVAWLATPCFAADQVCLLNDTYCVNSGVSSSRSSAAASSRVKINPSAVPTEEGFGFEMIGYKDQIDIGLARGTGRIGAALSPANSEETFFGPPGLEEPVNNWERKFEKKKFPNQKTTLATAFNLYSNKRTDVRRLSLNLGVMAKYNHKSERPWGGGGVSAVLGPFSAGFSVYQDQTVLEVRDPMAPPLTPPLLLSTEYNVRTYNVGLFLNSLILDYSHLVISAEDPATIDLVTASLLYKKMIFSVSQRREDSPRPKYDFARKDLVDRRQDVDYFAGLQVRVHKRFILGALYNYYLLREVSATGTFLF